VEEVVLEAIYSIPDTDGPVVIELLAIETPSMIISSACLLLNDLSKKSK